MHLNQFPMKSPSVLYPGPSPNTSSEAFKIRAFSEFANTPQALACSLRCPNSVSSAFLGASMLVGRLVDGTSLLPNPFGKWHLVVQFLH